MSNQKQLLEEKSFHNPTDCQTVTAWFWMKSMRGSKNIRERARLGLYPDKKAGKGKAPEARERQRDGD